jgi:phosphotransferase system  glucose/maltose/N-acetylglucosamine-specific IIC component
VIIRISWLKYIFASLGLIFTVIGIADHGLSIVLPGLVATALLWTFGYVIERSMLYFIKKTGGFANAITEGARPVTPLKRKVWGFAIIAFGVLIALPGQHQWGAGIFCAALGILVLKPSLLHVDERKIIK